MKIRLKTTLTLTFVLTALLASSVTAADDDALIRRMAGTYLDNVVVLRQQFSGSPDSFAAFPVAFTLPRGKGRVSGNIAGVLPVSGQVTKVRVSGRKVTYTGRLNITSPGVILRQQTFRAVASAAGPKKEVLALTFKMTGSVPPNTVTISGVFRGIK